MPFRFVPPIPLSLLLLLPFASSGQAEAPRKPRTFSLGAVFSPDYGYRTLQATDFNSPVAAARNRMEVPDLRYTAGFSLLYQADRRWTFEAGLYRADRGYKTATSYFFSPPPGKTETVTTYYHYIFLELPLKVDYAYVTGSCRLYATAGIVPQRFLTYRTTVIKGYEGQGFEKGSHARGQGAAFTASVIAGLGMDYAMSRRFHARIEPVYRQALRPVREVPVDVYLYSAGVNLGLFYRL